MSGALERMLRLVEERERREREAILAQARAEARRIVAEARAEVRQRGHQDVQELRQWMRREIGRAEAAFETAKRRHRSKRDAALLEAGWGRLREALAARWRDPAGRRAWVEMLLREARASLPKTAWDIPHPRDWPEAERGELARRLERELGHPPRFHPSPDCSAGLKLCAGGACLDGTLEGILLDRPAIEARLLAELGREASKRQAAGAGANR
jgi:vacuolar-type H+-ATPase subunit H